LSTEADKIKIEVERAQEERMRIRQKETEINERLQDVFNKLLQAGVDKQESQREAKLKETLSNLKRVFPGMLRCIPCMFQLTAPGVHGRVMDLCKPTQSKYDTAVMTILGRHTNAVIVEQEKTAIDCIEYMKNQRAGSATFIPLDTIQVKAVPERLRNSVKGARLAIDCIDYDPNVERAFQHVCGNAMICDTMAIAKEVCYEKAQGVKGMFTCRLVSGEAKPDQI
jgi:structural maintenance of chromosome 1